MDNGLKIVKCPLLSEKSSEQGEADNKVYFKVASGATKPQLREAIERYFKVKVRNVNTMVMPGKPYHSRRGFKKNSSWKKAVVTLREGDKIEFFKGV